MHRFFISPEQLNRHHVRFDDVQAHQMRRVLRLRPGDRVLALDGQGRQYEVVLEEVSNGRVAGLVAAQADATGEPRVRLTLFQSLLQRDKFEWVLQKGTEIGVAEFVPVITRRSLVREADVGEAKLERWRRIIKEAAEQSGRAALPRLAGPMPFEAGAAEAVACDRALIAWEQETSRTIRDVLGGLQDVASVALLIGPEGGYEPAEVETALARGALPVTLGRRVLRTETAAVVGAALVLYELGEMGAPGE
jgi:16S rRNA (uracil1498-N3)-methyltransferase